MTIVRLRVTLTGDGPWQAVFADDRGELSQHAIAMVRDGDRAYPAAMGGLAAATIAAAVASLRDGEATPAAVVELGRHLFAALCAPAWPAIEQRLGSAAPSVLELALDLDGAVALRALPWELMVGGGGDGWLAQGVQLGTSLVDVTITRRTVTGVATSPPLAHPLRYLFVIGTGLGDEIRAGAECLGMLRQLGAEVQDRIVERVSLKELARVIGEFDPHVVHVICHGREREHGGIELELWDGDRNLPVFVGAQPLADALARTVDGQRRVPAMVVLSACSSGDRMLPPRDTGLARALLAAGVPIVIGMAAAIHDQACRLFARTLGEALIRREPVLEAVARGRRAALRNRPGGDPDWGLVQVMLGHQVAPGLAVAAAAPDSDDALMMSWLEDAGLEINLPNTERSYPPLCAGDQAIKAFYRLLAGERAGMVVLAQPPRVGVKMGRRRVLSELAAIAIRGGHLPVLVMSRLDRPRDRVELVTYLARALKATWRRHGLGGPTSNQLGALAANGAIDGEALADALEADCQALRERARAVHPLVQRLAGQVVLFFHDLHDYGEAVPLVLELLRVRGKALRRIAPVVASWKQLGPSASPLGDGARPPVHYEVLKSTLEAGATYLEPVYLVPLVSRSPGPMSLAARLALQRVLLHPYRKTPASATQRWLLDVRTENPASRAALRHLALAADGCCPGQFADDRFWDALTDALETDRDFPAPRALTEADDDRLLAAGGRP